MAGNANSGRRPQPSALKVLRGNPGKRAINTNEPTPPDGPVERPTALLSRPARLVWDRLAPICIAMRTLTAADVDAFSTLCELRATFLAVAKQKRAVVNERDVKLERELATAMRPYYEKFGLEPSGRARLRLPAQEPPKSKWAGILA